MTLKANSYSRDFQTVADSDEDRDTCIPRFYLEAEAYEVEGQPHFRDVEMVEIIMPGNSLTKPVHYVSDLDRKRWPKSYAAFKSNQEMPVSGTPLEQWATLTKGMVLRLKVLGFRSVEDVSRMSENAMREVGLGARGLQQKALAFVDSSARTAISDKAIAAAEHFEARCAELSDQNRTLNEQVQLMGEQLRQIMLNQQRSAQNVASTPQAGNYAVQAAIQHHASPFAAFDTAQPAIEERQAVQRGEFAAFKGPEAPAEPEAVKIDLQIPAKRGRKSNAQKAAEAAAAQAEG